MTKLTEIDKLKYWLDAEISFTHLYLVFIIALLVNVWWMWALFGGYAVFQLIYIVVRVAYVAQDDPDFLKVPKKK